jgi:hypothetical protein
MQLKPGLYMMEHTMVNRDPQEHNREAEEEDPGQSFDPMVDTEDEEEEEIPLAMMIILIALAVGIAVIYLTVGGGHSHFH